MERSNPHENEDGFPEGFRDRIQRELIEQLPDSPEEPSEMAVRFRVAVQSAVLQAHEHGRPLADDDAEVIAELLSCAIDTPDSALGIYGRGNGADYNQTRQELIKLATRPTLRPEIREVINWVASYLLYQQAPTLQPAEPANHEPWNRTVGYKPELGLTATFTVRGVQDEPVDGEVLDNMTRFLLEHGVPGLAYLRLPDVDASATDLDEQFRGRHIGSYASISAFVDEQIRVWFVPEEGTLGERMSYADLPPAVQEQMLNDLGPRVCAVDVGGQVHAFLRP